MSSKRKKYIRTDKGFIRLKQDRDLVKFESSHLLQEILSVANTALEASLYSKSFTSKLLALYV